MCSRVNKERAAGFTLIELLVALTILGGLLAVTYSGFRVALTMWEKGNASTEAFQEQRTTVAILRDQLRGAIPLTVIKDELPVQRPQLAFEGQARSVRFVSRGSWRDGSRGLPRWIELTWAGRLIVEEKPIIPPFNEPGIGALWHSEITIFKELEIKYLSRKTAETAAEWTDVWHADVRRELPAAIQFRYRIQDEWETLLVPLDYAEANWQGYGFQ